MKHEQEELILKILESLGEQTGREGLRETPKRVVKSWETLFSGYSQDPSKIITTFESDTSEIVLLRDIEMYSFCEHHMLPFFGKAHVAYIPNGKVIGVSKLARVVDIFARRLQIQERIGQQVCSALMEHLKPLGVGVVIEAKHLCMMARGVGKQNSIMQTSCLHGVFQEPHVKAEFLSLLRK